MELYHLTAKVKMAAVQVGMSRKREWVGAFRVLSGDGACCWGAMVVGDHTFAPALVPHSEMLTVRRPLRYAVWAIGWTHSLAFSGEVAIVPAPITCGSRNHCVNHCVCDAAHMLCVHRLM